MMISSIPSTSSALTTGGSLSVAETGRVGKVKVQETTTELGRDPSLPSAWPFGNASAATAA